MSVTAEQQKTNPKPLFGCIHAPGGRRPCRNSITFSIACSAICRRNPSTADPRCGVRRVLFRSARIRGQPFPVCRLEPNLQLKWVLSTKAAPTAFSSTSEPRAGFISKALGFINFSRPSFIRCFVSKVSGSDSTTKSLCDRSSSNGTHRSRSFCSRSECAFRVQKTERTFVDGKIRLCSRAWWF